MTLLIRSTTCSIMNLMIAKLEDLKELCANFEFFNIKKFIIYFHKV